MGSGQSNPRTITIVNNDQQTNVQVTKDVIERLRKSEKLRDRSDEMQSPGSDKPTTSSNVDFQPNYSGSATSMEILKFKEAELKEQDAYWRKRMNNLLADHHEVNSLFEEEYRKAKVEMQGLFQESSEKYNSPPCTDKKELVTKCYADNPKQPLLCSKLVSEYATCVDSHRTKRLQTRS